MCQFVCFIWYLWAVCSFASTEFLLLNSRSQLSHLAEPLLTDPGLKSELYLWELISTWKKKKRKKITGGEWFVELSPEILCMWGKSHGPPKLTSETVLVLNCVQFLSALFLCTLNGSCSRHVGVVLNFVSWYDCHVCWAKLAPLSHTSSPLYTQWTELCTLAWYQVLSCQPVYM